jgi:hypothetical protein
MTTQAVKISTGGVKKGRNEGLKVITANRLTDGLPVYFTLDETWTLALTEAASFEGDAALEALTTATAQETEVVGPYLMDVEEGQSPLVPDGRGRLREEIRRDGPTVQSDYQAGA